MAKIEPQEIYSPEIAAIRERLRNGGYATASMRAASARAHDGRPRCDLNTTIANIQRLRTSTSADPDSPSTSAYSETFPTRPPAARLVVNNDRPA